MYSVYTDDPDERCGPGDIGLHRLASIEDAQAAAEEHHGGPLFWASPTHSDPRPTGGNIAYIIEEEDSMTEELHNLHMATPESEKQSDLNALIAEQVRQQLGTLVQPAPQSFEEALAVVDPADSEAALAMLDFLLKTGRLNRVGVLDGGAGYLFVYQEPKGSTKQGYKPGATQGDRLVDEAVEAQRAAGKKPVKQGMCVHCYSVVSLHSEGVLVLDEPDGTDGATCSNSPDGKHEMA